MRPAHPNLRNVVSCNTAGKTNLDLQASLEEEILSRLQAQLAPSKTKSKDLMLTARASNFKKSYKDLNHGNFKVAANATFHRFERIKDKGSKANLEMPKLEFRKRKQSLNLVKQLGPKTIQTFDSIERSEMPKNMGDTQGLFPTEFNHFDKLGSLPSIQAGLNIITREGSKRSIDVVDPGRVLANQTPMNIMASCKRKEATNLPRASIR